MHLTCINLNPRAVILQVHHLLDIGFLCFTFMNYRFVCGRLLAMAMHLLFHCSSSHMT